MLRLVCLQLVELNFGCFGEFVSFCTSCPFLMCRRRFVSVVSFRCFIFQYMRCRHLPVLRSYSSYICLDCFRLQNNLFSFCIRKAQSAVSVKLACFVLRASCRKRSVHTPCLIASLLPFVRLPSASLASAKPQAAQALSTNHASNAIWHKGFHEIFYKISMEVIKSQNSQ